MAYKHKKALPKLIERAFTINRPNLQTRNQSIKIYFFIKNTTSFILIH